MRRSSYLLTLGAILLWSGLACAAAALRIHDPLLITGIGLTIGGIPSLFCPRAWRVPPIAWLVGVGGILGYHVVFFAAFGYAPAIAVNLVNELWPLLMVVLAPLVLGGRLSLRQVVGALLGLFGTVVLVARDDLELGGDAIGYLLAAAAALIWALYSLFTKRLPTFPTATVGCFCLVSGAGALAMAAVRHDGLGGMLPTILPMHWALLVAVGCGPLGAAFWCWDAAIKRGDPQIIGMLAYLTPLLATLWLVASGQGRLDWRAGVALVLIVGGAVLGIIRDGRVDEAR